MPSEPPAEAPIVLGFDTSAAQCAAALVSGERVLARRVEPMARGHAERLMPMLGELLAEAGLGWEALDGIAVCTGPGNFTGIRIGVAAARGLALALGRPAVGLTAFEAQSLADPRRRIVVVRVGGRPFGQEMADGKSLGPAGPHESEAEPPLVDPAWLARGGAARLRGAQDVAPPSPFYLRPPDAAPGAEPPPRMLDK